MKTRLLSCVDKAKRVIGYEPKMSFKDGLRRPIGGLWRNRENIEKSASFHE